MQIADLTQALSFFAEIFLVRSIFQGKDFEMTLKMETRHPAENQFEVNFRRSVIIAELRRPSKTWKFLKQFLLFLEKRP